jgi:hypothetical protein
VAKVPKKYCTGHHQQKEEKEEEEEVGIRISE